MLAATYLGHQSWFIESPHHSVLVDPVLTRTFGNSDTLKLEIWPPRVIDVNQMPKTHAVVLTNEHLDHFHLESLALIDRSVQVVVPSIFPSVSIDAMEALGFRVVSVPADGTEHHIGDLSVSFASPEPGTVPVWEARCASALIRSNETQESVFVQSDTIPSKQAITVDIFIATHNGQIRPDGWIGGLDNLLDRRQVSELQVLQEMVASVDSCVQGSKWVTFSGGSYRHIPRRHGPFLLADFPALAERLNSFSLDFRYRGLLPGQVLNTDGSVKVVNWVSHCDPMTGDDFVTARKPGDLSVIPIFDQGVPRDGDEEAVRDELRKLSRLIAATTFGQKLVDANQWGGHPAEPNRLVFQFKRKGATDLVAKFSINSGGFTWEESRLVDNIKRTPFGLVCWLSDFARVLDGTIQIWELATTATIQWYAGESRYSPLGFLYEALAEPVRPDLASAVYARVVNSLVAPVLQ
jgi:hypothetical protein